jgi:excisionase family DNA binding protein
VLQTRICYSACFSVSEGFTAATMATMPTFLTADELAAILRCQPEKVYRLAAHGELPSYKVQGRRLFDHDEVARWLEGRRDGERVDARGAA